MCAATVDALKPAATLDGCASSPVFTGDRLSAKAGEREGSRRLQPPLELGLRKSATAATAGAEPGATGPASSCQSECNTRASTATT